MWLEHNNFWFSQKELRNNNLNPELNKFLEDNELSKEEANILVDAFNENKSNILIISKRNLSKLRKILWLSSKRNYITTKDKNTIATYIPREYNEKYKSKSFWKKLSRFISKNWYLKNVSKVRLDQLVSPYQKTKFSITLSKNSIYSSRLDWKTFNVVWWKDKRTWKYTYVFENWPLKRTRVLISNWDKLWEYQENINNIRNNKIEKKYSKKTKEYKNISERNRSFIDWLKLPENYKKIALEFASKLKNNEILTKRTPIALVDGKRKEMLYTVNWRKIIVPVLLWKNWVTYWWYVPWDRKTLAWKIHRFDAKISKITSSLDWDASNSWNSKTVKSASLQSSLSMATGWRYFHWVDDYRIKWRFKWMWTWWCVWVDKSTIRKMYYDVKKNWIWYGYVW
jgi:hypothetical protein